MKLPRFMLSEDPTSSFAGDTTFITHTANPSFIAIVVDDGVDDDYIDAHHPLSEYVAYISQDTAMLELYKLVPLDIDKYDTTIISNIMKDMSKWYLRYITWEDKQQYKSGTPLILSDFSPKINNLKIITNEKETTFILLYKGDMMYFHDEQSIKTYLMTLGLDESDFRTGYINIARLEYTGLN